LSALPDSDSGLYRFIPAVRPMILQPRINERF
jgi:hypothetical protein